MHLLLLKKQQEGLSENGFLKVTANENDRELSNKLDVVDIKGDHAIWKNSWDAAGTPGSMVNGSLRCSTYGWSSSSQR
jgi:hypothetical protein